MKLREIKITDIEYPDRLRQIHGAPKILYCVGETLEKLLTGPVVAIVGSRKVTSYGRNITAELAGRLAEAGVTVVSGLAIGADGIAHKATLDAGGKTIAVMPCGLDRIYPSNHFHLAKQILQQGGALVSEYPEKTEPFPSNFVARNRIVSGLSHAVLITEAAEKSGSLHTANFALEQGRDVLAVPGNINSLFSVGTNDLIKNGAVAVTQVNDVLSALGISQADVSREVEAASKEEHVLLSLIKDGLCDGEELLVRSGLGTPTFNQTLTMLEITGKVKASGNGQWNLS